MFFAANMTISAHAAVAATQHMVAIPFWLEMLAIVAASISGVLTAREHKLDLIGAVALAVVCGLGGMVGTCYVRYLRYETKAYCDCFAGGSTSERHKLTAAMFT